MRMPGLMAVLTTARLLVRESCWLGPRLAARGADMTKRRTSTLRAVLEGTKEAEAGEETLMVLQHLVDLLLDRRGQIVEISRPLMTAANAFHHDDGEASYDEHATVVVTRGTYDGERVVRVRHVRGDADRSAELAHGARTGSVMAQIHDFIRLASSLYGIKTRTDCGVQVPQSALRWKGRQYGRRSAATGHLRSAARQSR